MMRLRSERENAPTASPLQETLYNANQQAKTCYSAVASYVPSADFVPSDTFDLTEGDKVEHLKFGFGQVTKMDINGTDSKATVKFDLVGEKTLLLSFAKLRILK
jgi:DNA helicase-2/ATP-dependent DNA helicase PcrA